MLNNKVVVIKTKDFYPSFPYARNKVYPEFKDQEDFSSNHEEENHIFNSIRNLLFNLGLDKENFNTQKWNPLKGFLKPGGTVLIKPNWVKDINPLNSKNLDSLVTHSSFIKAIIDYALLALDFRGKIIIGDAPLQSCNFSSLLEKTKVNELIDYYRKNYKNVEFLIEDWRLTTLEKKNKQETKEIDEKKYEIIDLKEKSFLEEIVEYSDRFRVTRYDPDLTIKHHQRGKHEYLFTKRVFEADLIINLPKLKTHIKTGLTAALKNLVGFNGLKEFLPHHIKGSFLEGGDNYLNPSFFKKIYENFYDDVWAHVKKNSVFINRFNFLILRILDILWKLFSKDKIYAGSWQGNETCWRMVLDLNHIFYFYDQNKKCLNRDFQRNVLTIVDGIIAGQAEGPLMPLDKKLGLIIGGFNPALIDALVAKIIGYNLARIPLVYNALYNIQSFFSLKNDENIFIEWIEENKKNVMDLKDISGFDFIVPKHWVRALGVKKL